MKSHILYNITAINLADVSRFSNLVLKEDVASRTESKKAQ